MSGEEEKCNLKSVDTDGIKTTKIISLMGVSGSGKTTVGKKLAEALGWPFRDADEFHPASNIAKMSAGIPLTDQDRAPWLMAIRTYIDVSLAGKQNAVITCSALKQRYREVLNAPPPGTVKWVYLKGSRELLESRLAGRSGHFMKVEMLAGQLATLEEPNDALTLNIAESLPELVKQIREAFAL